MSDERTTVAIVGAGPAGLAVGACLRRAGIGFVILEKGPCVAPAWRRHYARLHLHTVKRYSALPFAPFPKTFPRYVPRDLMVRYLDSYAADFDLRPRFGEAVRSIRRQDEHWVVEAMSVRLLAPHVVVASGNNAEPVIPAIAGMARFRGKVVHSVDYVDAAPFAGQAVLIVGMGNTGAEIALDLAEGGARPTISVRDGVHVVPRELFGVPIQVVGMLATRLLPRRANDRLFPLILDLALGNLERYGIRRPKLGLLQQIATASRIPVIDVGTVKAIAAGAIKIAPGIAEITETGAAFSDGRTADFDSVILATGYRPNYRDFLEAPERAGARTPGLHFVGFHNPVTGLLHEIAREAEQVADVIRGDVEGRR
jgi:cation diffusion facilitator CzcD-associated flavoprotein CzcO